MKIKLYFSLKFNYNEILNYKNLGSIVNKIDSVF